MQYPEHPELISMIDSSCEYLSFIDGWILLSLSSTGPRGTEAYPYLFVLVSLFKINPICFVLYRQVNMFISCQPIILNLKNVKDYVTL